MTIFLYIIHIIVCVILIGVVLLQSGKAADLAGAFGGGGSQTALGSRGAATVLTKATTIAAVLFMLTSLGLALNAARQGGSVLEGTPIPVEGSGGTTLPPLEGTVDSDEDAVDDSGGVSDESSFAPDDSGEPVEGEDTGNPE